MKHIHLEYSNLIGRYERHGTSTTNCDGNDLVESPLYLKDLFPSQRAFYLNLQVAGESQH